MSLGYYSKKVSFVDAENKIVRVQIEVGPRNGYPELSMTGERQGSFGQVLDDVVPATKAQSDLIELWKNHHLKNVGDGEEFVKSSVKPVLEKLEEEKRERKAGKKEVSIRNKKIVALAQHLRISIEEANEDIILRDATHFDYLGEEYIVATDAQADILAKGYILDTAWAFNTDFLARHLKDGLSEFAEDILKPLQEKCESGNKAVLALINDKTKFVRDAIRSDGRGNFLNPYDGKEYSEQVEGIWYYIYKIN